MSALVKLGMLFAGGVTLGLVVPWGFGPGKSPRPDDVGQSGDRTVNVRCIVEYRQGGQVAQAQQGEPPAGKQHEPDGNQVRGRRRPPLPEGIDAQGPPPVEVVVKPGQKGPHGADDVTVILRVNSCCSRPDAANAPPERPMPGEM